MTGYDRWRLAQRLLGVIYPARCPVCDELLNPEETVYSSAAEGAGVHRDCMKDIYRVSGPVCLRCGRPLSAENGEYCRDCLRVRRNPDRTFDPKMDFDQGKALFLYKDPLKSMMYRFKYQNRREYGDYFAADAGRVLGEWIRRIRPQAIIPVPMYLPKQKKRGYNQAAVFAKALSRRMDIPWDGNFIRRIKNTKPMKNLNDIQRKNNLKNAFQIVSKGVKCYQSILLVDDIYTTGSTAQEVSRTIKNAGTEAVYVMSICIGEGV